jgi:hypothetical protein
MIAAAVLATSCQSQGPAKPQPGTPAFQWLSAQDAFKKGDYVRAASLLSDLAARPNDYQERARPMAALLSYGLMQGYMDLADKYAAGAKKARTNAAPLYRLTGEYRAKAVAAGKRYVELMRGATARYKEKGVELEPGLPEGLANDPPQYAKILAGSMPPAPEVELAEVHVLRREAMKYTLRAMGVPDNAAKGREMFASGKAQVPGGVYLTAMANFLFETGELFGPKKLSQPSGIRQAVYDEALATLAAVPETKDTVALRKKILAAIKTGAT